MYVCCVYMHVCVCVCGGGGGGSAPEKCNVCIVWHSVVYTFASYFKTEVCLTGRKTPTYLLKKGAIKIVYEGLALALTDLITSYGHDKETEQDGHYHQHYGMNPATDKHVWPTSSNGPGKTVHCIVLVYDMLMEYNSDTLNRPQDFKKAKQQQHSYSVPVQFCHYSHVTQSFLPFILSTEWNPDERE